MDVDLYLELTEVPSAATQEAERLRSAALTNDNHPTMHETREMAAARHDVSVALQRAASAYDAYATAVRGEMRKWR